MAGTYYWVLVLKPFRAALNRILPSAGLARSVGVLASGTAIGQFLVVLSSPILTRIYTPADLGALAVYASVLGLFSVVSSLRYEQSIALPEDSSEASSTVVLSLAMLVGTSTLLLLSVWLVVPKLPLPAPWEVARPLLWLLPFSVFAVGLYQTLSVWAIRTKEFGILAGTAWRQGLAGAVTQILLGMFGLGATGLIVGQVIGQSSGVVSLSRLIGRSHGFLAAEVDRRSIFAAAKRYKRFPLYSTWSGLLLVAGTSVPVALIAILFGPVSTGFYSLGLRALQTPLRTLGNAVSQVFLAESPRAARDGSLVSLVLPALSRLSAIASPIAVILASSGAPLAQFAFGLGWREAGIFIQWLTPWVFLTMVTSPLAPLFTTLERQDVGLYFNAASLLIRTAALLLGSYLGGAATAIALFSVSSFAVQWWLLEWLSSAAGVPRVEVRRVVGGGIVRALPLALPFIAIRFLPSPHLREILSVAYAIGALVYIGMRAFLKR